MARQALTIQALTYNGGTVSSIGGTIVAADGAYVAAGGNTRRLFLHVTAGTIAGTITVLAGDNPPAFRKDLGDLTVALTANQIKFVCIESARFTQDDGNIHIDSTGELVVVKPYRLPDEL